MASSFSKPSTYTVVVKLSMTVRNVDGDVDDDVAVVVDDADDVVAGFDGCPLFTDSGEYVVKL